MILNYSVFTSTRSPLIVISFDSRGRQSVPFPLYNSPREASKGAIGFSTFGRPQGKEFTALVQQQGQHTTGAQPSRHKKLQTAAAPSRFTGPPSTSSSPTQNNFDKVHTSVHHALNHEDTSHVTSNAKDEAASKTPADPEPNSAVIDQMAYPENSLSSGHDGEKIFTDETARLTQPTQTLGQKCLQNPFQHLHLSRTNVARSSDSNKPATIHGVSSRHTVAKIRKPGPSSRHYSDASKPTRRSDESAATQQSPGPAQSIHSTQVLGIWQKLVVQEQRELTAKEKTRRETCEQEVMRLQMVEETQKSALDEAKKAKAHAATKLQRCQDVNRELQENIQKLQQDCETSRNRSENLETAMQLLEDAKLQTEKKLKALEAGKEALVSSGKIALEKAKSELELVKKELECANEVKVMHERELGQRAGELSESRDKQASLEALLKGALANYDNITKAFESRDDPVKKSLDGILKSLNMLREHQLTKDSIEEFLETIRSATPSTSSHPNGLDNLEVVLQSFTIE